MDTERQCGSAHQDWYPDSWPARVSPYKSNKLFGGSSRWIDISITFFYDPRVGRLNGSTLWMGCNNVV